jgi:hypothetical protein
VDSMGSKATAAKMSALFIMDGHRLAGTAAAKMPCPLNQTNCMLSSTIPLSSHAEHILKRLHDLHGMHSRHQQVFTKFLTNEKNHQKKKRGRKHVVFADTPKVLLPKKTRTKNKTKLKQMQLLGGGITKCGPAKAGGKLYSQSAPRHGLLPAATTSPTTSGDIPVVYSCPAVACLLLVSSKYRPASCSKPGRHIYNTAHC